MSKRGQFWVGGAIAFVIGLVITLWGYNKFISVERVLTEVVTEVPPGAIEATIGILHGCGRTYRYPWFRPFA